MHDQAGPGLALAQDRLRAAGLLQYTYRWLSAASAVTPPVTAAAAALTVAVQLYGAGQYRQALHQLAAAVTVLHQAREVYPALPPL
jgi:predicted metal-binding membrane protein